MSVSLVMSIENYLYRYGFLKGYWLGITGRLPVNNQRGRTPPTPANQMSVETLAKKMEKAQKEMGDEQRGGKFTAAEDKTASTLVIDSAGAGE